MLRSLTLNGVMFSVNEREALERGGFDAALLRLPPILISILNTIALTLPIPISASKSPPNIAPAPSAETDFDTDGS